MREQVTHVSDCLLCFVFSISCFLDSIFHLALNLNQVSLQLLLGVDEAGVLSEDGCYFSFSV